MALIADKIKLLKKFISRDDGGIITKALRGSIWVTIAALLSNVLTLVRSIILARILMPEIFGLMGICIVAVRAIEVFTQTGFGAALIQRESGREDARDTAFTLSVIRGLLLGIVMIAVAPCVARFYNKEILDQALQLLSIVFIINGTVNVNTIIYQKELNFKKLSYLSIIENLVNFIVIVSLAYYLRNLWALVVGYIVAAIIHMVFSYILVDRRFNIRIDRVIAKELLQYGKYITGVTIILFIATEIDTILIGKMNGVDVLGFYVLAYTIANIVTTQLSKLISGVMLPAYSKLQNDVGQLKVFYLEVCRIIGIIIIPTAAALIVLSHDIIHVVYGERWAGAIVPLQILALFGAIRSFAAINGYLFNGVGKPAYDFYSGASRLFILIIIIAPLSIYYGINGVAVAVTIGIIIQYLVGLHCMRNILQDNMSTLLKIYYKPIIYASIMAMILLSMKMAVGTIAIKELLLMITVGMVFYMYLSRRDVLLLVQNVNKILAR